jgi:hypothetical protein
MERYSLTTIQKLIIGAGLALLGWRLLQEPAIFNPLINFLGAGVVPGTQQALSPDAILKIILACFMVAILAIFIRLFVWRRPLGKTKRAVASAPTPSLVSPRPAKHRLAAVKAFWLRHAANMHRPAMPAWLPRLLRTVISWLRRTGLRLWAIMLVLASQAWLWVEPRIRRFDTWLEVRLNGNEITLALLDVIRRTVSFAKHVWHKAEERLPHSR